MIRAFLLWASQNPWLAENLPNRPFMRRAVRRFLPGEDRSQALVEAERLGGLGIGTVFTVLGENISEAAEVAEVIREYSELLVELKSRGIDGEISVKPTQLGLDLDWALAVDGLRTLARAAAEARSFVWVDMESSPYLRPTLELFEEVQGPDAPAGLCLQAYLRSSPEDLRGILNTGAAVRIVKGAYAEPAELAYPRKGEVDAAFFELVTTTLRRGGRVAIATHDEDMVKRIRGWIKKDGIPSDRFEYQMLFGIRSALQEKLAAEGEPVRVLISYGPAWFPWYMRRLAERPANLWFVVKNFFHR